MPSGNTSSSASCIPCIERAIKGKMTHVGDGPKGTIKIGNGMMTTIRDGHIETITFIGSGDWTRPLKD